MPDLVVRILSKNLAGRGIKLTEKQVRGLKNEVNKASRRLKFMGLAAAGIGVMAVREFGKFDKGIREIGTLLDNVTEASIKSMGNEIRSMAIQYGQSIDKMTKAKYDIISAGFTDAADSAQLLAVAAKLAAGGASDVAKTTDVLTSVLNAYGKTAKDAEHFSDVLFTTVRLGKTTIDELSGSLGRAAAIAPQIGVSFEQLAAATATVTAGGQSTDEVMTALTALMSNMLKPTENLASRIRDMGFASGKALIQSKGLFGALMSLKEGMTETDIAGMFPNVRALKAIFPLIGTLAGKFEKNVAAMGETAGATETAFAKMQEGVQFRLDQMSARLNSAMISIGNALLPLAEGLTSLVEGFSNLDSATQQAAVAFGIATTAILVLKGVIVVALGPFGLLLGAITALSIAVVTYGNASSNAAKQVDEFKTSLQALSIEQVKQQIIELEAEQKKLVDSYGGGEAAWDITREVVGTVTGTMGLLNAATSSYIGEVEIVNEKLEVAKTKYNELIEAQSGLNEKANEAITSIGTKTTEVVTAMGITWNEFFAGLNEQQQLEVEQWLTTLDEKGEAFAEHQEWLMQTEVDAINQRTKNETDARKKRAKMLDVQATNDAKRYFADLKAKQKTDEEKRKSEEQLAQDKFRIMASIAGATADILGRQTAIGQAALVTQASMDTYAGANRALGAYPPPWGAIAAAAVVLQGLGNVNRIASMASGGFVKAQGGLQTGFDTVPVIARPGEAIISAENTRQNIPVINQLVAGQSVGAPTSEPMQINLTQNIQALDSESLEEYVRRPEYAEALVGIIKDGVLQLKAGDKFVTGEV